MDIEVSEPIIYNSLSLRFTQSLWLLGLLKCEHASGDTREVRGATHHEYQHLVLNPLYSLVVALEINQAISNLDPGPSHHFHTSLNWDQTQDYPSTKVKIPERRAEK